MAFTEKLNSYTHHAHTILNIPEQSNTTCNKVLPFNEGKNIAHCNIYGQYIRGIEFNWVQTIKKSTRLVKG